MAAGKRGRSDVEKMVKTQRAVMLFVENAGDDSMLLRACFHAIREEVPRPGAAGEKQRSLVGSSRIAEHRSVAP